MKPLSDVDVFDLELHPLTNVLDTRCDDLHANSLGELNQGVNYSDVFGGPTERTDEMAIEFDDVDGEIFEFVERRVLWCEVVDSESNAESLQTLKTKLRSVIVIDQRGLGELENERWWVELTRHEDLFDVADESFALELLDRDIGRYGESVTPRVPRRALFARRSESPVADVDHLVARFESGHELIGADDAVLGISPSKKRLDAGERIGEQVDGRLVHQEELLVHERVGESLIREGSKVGGSVSYRFIGH